MEQKSLAIARLFYQYKIDYLFITYIVTSKPKRISVAAGVVHIIILLFINLTEQIDI
jgi:hypothetical protein